MALGKNALFSEPKVLITGVEGAGKTLLAVQQADLMAQAEGGDIFQVNIRGADPGHLPKLPFDLREMSTEKDPETGDLLPRWAVELKPGSVVIVDEAHKVYPQRGPGRPSKDIEMLAEGRQKGIRFIYLSQSPESIDGFLRDRIHRHFHLERRGNMERATVFEFDHAVYKPRTAWQERKDATVHFWAYPKEYFGWYTSAKTHHFKRRVPWKIFAALLFVPIAVYGGYRVVSKVGGLKEATMPGIAPGGAVASVAASRDARAKVTTDPMVYAAQFSPLVPFQPWSAPAYQDRDVVAEPELYCMASKAGSDAQGDQQEAGCSCLTEQGTPYTLQPEFCRHIAAKGNYNPYRQPVGKDKKGRDNSDRDREGPKLGEARQGPSSVAQSPESPVSGGASYGSMSTYGGMGVGNSPR